MAGRVVTREAIDPCCLLACSGIALMVGLIVLLAGVQGLSTGLQMSQQIAITLITSGAVIMAFALLRIGTDTVSCLSTVQQRHVRGVQ